MQNTRSDAILNFLKGLLMGVCDIIPGISGGTIAFITGIYERLIKAIKNVTSTETIKSLPMFFKSGRYSFLKKKLDKTDAYFLSNVAGGIFVGVLLVSFLVSFLLEHYEAYTIAFFVGLIFASSWLIYERIRPKKLKDISFVLVGFLVGLSLVFIVPADVENFTLLYVFVSGFIAVSAMFLPGLSGAYLLLILGMYEYMIGVLHNVRDKMADFFVFIIGGFFGVLVLSRIITFFLDKWHSKTLFFLLGIVLGGLSVPIKRIYDALPEVVHETQFIAVGLFLFVGILLIVFVKIFEKVAKK